VAVEFVMSVERDPQSGMYTVVGSDGSICEGPFVSRGSASRWIADRADLDDREVGSMVTRCNPAQRRELRRLLDEIEGVGAYGSA
jgi:hypothetical protein